MTQTATMSMEHREPGLSESQRIIDTFVAPTLTFKDILRSASWWLPFALAALLTLAVSFTIDRKVGFERVVENQIHSSPKQEQQLSTLAPEVRDRQLHSMAAGYRYTSYATPLIILAFSALGALVLWGCVNFGLGAHATFTQMLAVWMYASLPRLLTGVLTMISLIIGSNNEGFDLKNPVGTNLAYYLPDLSPALRTALSFLDIVGIWNLLLLILGVAIVARISRGKAAAVVLGLWVLGLIVSVASTAAFS